VPRSVTRFVARTTLIPLADSLLAVGAAEEALQGLESHLTLFPNDAEALWRAAKAVTLVGFLSPRLTEARPFYREGIAYTDRVLANDPSHRDALTWSMIAKGRLALWTGARETAKLATDVWDISHRLIAENDENASAHHALGVLHFQVRKMSRVKRFLARTFLGGEALSKANWEGAFFHLARAIELEPSNKMFRLDHAKALENRGRRSETLAEANTGLEQPNTNPLTDRQHYLIQRFLTGLEK
jgi:tetratricopeptide (TPR) repeat protein